MSLEVIDFYNDAKIHITPFRVLVNSAYFILCVKEDGVTKGLDVRVPSRYRFSRTIISKNYDPEALKQYNILIDFLTTNKKYLKDKWCLTNKRYNDLLHELRFCLAKKYAKGCCLKKFFILSKEYLRLKFYLFRSRIK